MTSHQIKWTPDSKNGEINGITALCNIMNANRLFSFEMIQENDLEQMTAHVHQRMETFLKRWQKWCNCHR